MNNKIIIGVLALHGSVEEHIKAVRNCGVKAVEVRTTEELSKCAGLIIPGGESTTVMKLLAREGLDKTIISRARKGMPVFGTCTGAIVLSKAIVGNNQPTLGLIDISVRRNAYGRQVDSFESMLDIAGVGKVKAIFIRASIVESIGKGVKVLAKYKNKPVLVQQGNILAGTFHPELTDDLGLHKYFLKIIKIR